MAEETLRESLRKLLRLGGWAGCAETERERVLRGYDRLRTKAEQEAYYAWVDNGCPDRMGEPLKRFHVSS
jgi:hypothetical protein